LGEVAKMSVRTRIVFSIVLGIVVAAVLTVGLDALSQPVVQLVAEKSMLSTTPPMAGRGLAQDNINIARVSAVWQFLPSLLLALVAAFGAYTFSRLKF
jgi:hypothetical protein